MQALSILSPWTAVIFVTYECVRAGIGLMILIQPLTSGPRYRQRAYRKSSVEQQWKYSTQLTRDPVNLRPCQPQARNYLLKQRSSLTHPAETQCFVNASMSFSSKREANPNEYIPVESAEGGLP